MSKSSDLSALCDDIIPKLEALPEAEFEDTAKEVLRTIYRADLYRFVKYCLGYNLLVPHVHRELCDALMELVKDNGRERVLNVMPRGTFKSTITTVGFPIWLVLRDPNVRILLDSETYENSEKYLREIVGHFKNPYFVWLWGNHLGKGSFAREGEFQSAMRTKVHKEGTITCSGVGAAKTGLHFTHIVSDDLSSSRNSQTKEQREKVHNHYKLYTSLAEPNTGRVAIVGTRYHEDDLVGYVLNKLGLDARMIVN